MQTFNIWSQTTQKSNIFPNHEHQYLTKFKNKKKHIKQCEYKRLWTFRSVLGGDWFEGVGCVFVFETKVWVVLMNKTITQLSVNCGWKITKRQLTSVTGINVILECLKTILLSKEQFSKHNINFWPKFSAHNFNSPIPYHKFVNF